MEKQGLFHLPRWDNKTPGLGKHPIFSFSPLVCPQREETQGVVVKEAFGIVGWSLSISLCRPEGERGRTIPAIGALNQRKVNQGRKGDREGKGHKKGKQGQGTRFIYGRKSNQHDHCSLGELTLRENTFQ